MWGYVWSRVNPNNILPGLLNYYYPYPRNLGIEIGYFDRNEGMQTIKSACACEMVSHGLLQSKKEGKGQESIQSSTTPDPGHQ